MPKYLILKCINLDVILVLREEIMDLVEKIKDMIAAEGYAGKSVGGEVVDALWQKFGQGISERVFAEKVLGLNPITFYKMRSPEKRKAIILKDRVVCISEDHLQEIKNKVQCDACIGSRISYEQLQALHQKYAKNLDEKQFAERVLEIEYRNYCEIKKQTSTKVTIFNKTKENVLPEQIQKIKEMLISSGYANKKIGYEALQHLHKKYGYFMTELIFAKQVLELSEESFYNVKNGLNATILKDNEAEITKDQAEQVKDELAKDGYTKKSIDYSELKFLHNKYGTNMSEYTFATIVLGINHNNYKRVKYAEGRAVILKDKDAMTNQQVELIQNELREAGYVNRAINYAEFLKLYQKYGSDVSEYSFAKSVLGINYNMYKCMKHNGKRATALKEASDIADENIEQIKNNLLNNEFKLRYIDYPEFLQIYNAYGSGMSEYLFAYKVLGWSYSTLYNAKFKGRRARILLKDVNINQVIAIYFKESRYYTLQEIQQISKDSGIAIEKLITNIPELVFFDNENSDEIQNILNKDKIFVGKTKCSNKFMESHYLKWKGYARNAIKHYCLLHNP